MSLAGWLDIQSDHLRKMTVTIWQFFGWQRKKIVYVKLWLNPKEINIQNKSNTNQMQRRTEDMTGFYSTLRRSEFAIPKNILK